MFALSLIALAARAAAPPAADPALPSAQAPASSEDGPAVGGRLTVLPGVGFRADPRAEVDGLSVGFLGRARELRGFDGQVVGSWVDGEVRGFQGASLATVAGGVQGAQGAGLLAVADHVHGFQGAGAIAVAQGDVVGVQASAMLNVAGGADSRAAQLSGGLNLANGMQGLQAAPLNVAGRVTGAQIGLVNVGREVHGTQIALVNIAKEAHGVSIAPLNFIGNGMFHLDVWASDTSVATAGIKFGSRHMYTMIAGGYVRPSDPWWTWGGGLGAQIPGGPGWLAIDASAWGVSNGLQVVPGVLGKLRINAGLSLAKRLSPFVGVSANTWVGDGSVWPRVVGLPSGRAAGRQVVSWPGIQAGVQF